MKIQLNLNIATLLRKATTAVFVKHATYLLLLHLQAYNADTAYIRNEWHYCFVVKESDQNEIPIGLN